MRHILLVLASAMSLFAMAKDPIRALSLEEKPLSAAEFESFTTGKTLNYDDKSVIFGTEFYKPGRKVLWAFTNDECHEGRWYPKDDAICFVYDDLNGPQCWQFFHNGTGLWAQFIGPEGPGSTANVSQSAVPLSCMGPKVGV